MRPASAGLTVRVPKAKTTGSVTGPQAVAKEVPTAKKAAAEPKKIAFVTKTGKSVEFSSLRQARGERKRVPVNLEERVKTWFAKQKESGQKLRAKLSKSAMRKVRKGVRETGVRNLEFVLDQVYGTGLTA